MSFDDAMTALDVGKTSHACETVALAGQVAAACIRSILDNHQGMETRTTDYVNPVVGPPVPTPLDND
jgi:hypothetical protein